MCIRDRFLQGRPTLQEQDLVAGRDAHQLAQVGFGLRNDAGCLLYTSDAADERSSVDLGGRRLINKNTLKSSASSAIR